MSRSSLRLTEFLEAHAAGEEGARDALFARCAHDLRTMARRRLSRERRNHTLQPTALVNEAYLRLFDGVPPAFTDTQTFFVAVAREMRRVLTDSARRRLAQKRQQAAMQVSIDDVNIPAPGPDALMLVALDEALVLLAAEAPRAAAVVELKFVVGLSTDEIAATFGVTARTIERDWKFAQARLALLLGAP